MLVQRPSCSKLQTCRRMQQSTQTLCEGWAGECSWEGWPIAEAAACRPAVLLSMTEGPEVSTKRQPASLLPQGEPRGRQGSRWTVATRGRAWTGCATCARPPTSAGGRLLPLQPGTQGTTPANCSRRRVQCNDERTTTRASTAKEQPAPEQHTKILKRGTTRSFPHHASCNVASAGCMVE
jgi:hypothetical protein